jgi:hypothetical protein
MRLLTASVRPSPSIDAVKRVPSTFALVLKASFHLVCFDLLLADGKFLKLYDKVRNYPTEEHAGIPNTIERIYDAINLASILYWKEIFCLQRSAATTCLLRDHGVPAQMVIGAQHLPFKAHAWVEVKDRVVSDKPYMHDIYAVLDRC